jgi:hypothetical protein
MTGEFVVKNLVLMAAGLVLAAASTSRATAPDVATREAEYEPPQLDPVVLDTPALNPTD